MILEIGRTSRKLLDLKRNEKDFEITIGCNPRIKDLITHWVLSCVRGVGEDSVHGA